LKYLYFISLLLCAAPSLAADTLVFTCERSENNYTETYQFKVVTASKNQKAKVFVDDRDLDRVSELGQQTVKSILIAEYTVLISMEAQFPPENFDGVQYGAGSVSTMIAINRPTGQLRKVQTVKGGILSATLGEGTKIYQEQCTAFTKP
jgi:hypothetical protein